MKGKELAFELAVVKMHEAKLHLVQVDKKGELTLLKEFTAEADFDWSEFTFALSDVDASGTAFLAFEYIGEAEKATTVYRVDNVKIRKIGATTPTLTENIVIAASEGRVTIKGLPEDLEVSVYDLNGEMKAARQSHESEITFKLPRGSYIVKLEAGEAWKVIVP